MILLNSAMTTHCEASSDPKKIKKRPRKKEKNKKIVLGAKKAEMARGVVKVGCATDDAHFLENDRPATTHTRKRRVSRRPPRSVRDNHPPVRG